MNTVIASSAVQLLNAKSLLFAPLAFLLALVCAQASEVLLGSLVFNGRVYDLSLDPEVISYQLQESTSSRSGSVPDVSGLVVGVGITSAWRGDVALSDRLPDEINCWSMSIVDMHLKCVLVAVDYHRPLTIEEAGEPSGEVSVFHVGEDTAEGVCAASTNVVDVETGIMIQLGGTYEALDWMRR